jgi:hypothetical protein
MGRQQEPRGYRLTKTDQVTILVVAVAILVVTGVLVGLLFQP